MTFATGYAFRPMTPLQLDKDRARVAAMRRAAGVTCADESLRRNADRDAAKADLVVLLDMLGLKETGKSGE